jgi:hypothetical protein
VSKDFGKERMANIRAMLGKTNWENKKFTLKLIIITALQANIHGACRVSIFNYI